VGKSNGATVGQVVSSPALTNNLVLNEIQNIEHKFIQGIWHNTAN
jgi:hypothetical protein